MAAAFQDQDLTDAVFWGVRLRGAHFRDVDFTGVRSHHVLLTDVEFDGTVDRLVVNGVDVTEYVHAHDPWQPLRGMTEPSTADEVRAAWPALWGAWDELIADVRARGDDAFRVSVDDEWTVIETLRHLVFVADKWVLGPLTDGSWEPIGLPNSGSQSFAWPAIDLELDPSLDEVLAARDRQGAAIDALVAELTDDDLAAEVQILENGTGRGHHCWGALFEHRRYVLRDLA